MCQSEFAVSMIDVSQSSMECANLLKMSICLEADCYFLEYVQWLPFLNFKPKSVQSVFPSVKQANASVKTNRWKEEVLEPGHEK